MSGEPSECRKVTDSECDVYFVLFRCTRVYWSTVNAKRRTVYTCRVIEVHPSENNGGALTVKVRLRLFSSVLEE